MIGCVILAAGNSARFRKNKLRENYHGKSLIRWAFEAVPTEQLGPVCVVTRFSDVEELAEAYGFRVVRNDAPELGISRSVILGTLELLLDRCEGLMFLVSDQPLLRRETVVALAERFRKDPKRIVVPTAEGRQGNPCIFPASLYPELLTLGGDCGGKTVIRSHPELVTEVPVPPEELADVDTLEDLQRLKRITKI